MYFYYGSCLSKCFKSLISLELIPNVVEIVIPRILPLTIKIMIPTIIKATKVVSENRILKTTNSTING